MDATYLQFIDRWTHPAFRAAPVAAAELDAVESTLGFRFPSAYREFLEHFGPASTHRGLLTRIVDDELDLPDVSSFVAPAEIAETMQRWQACGMPEELVVFATDCQGNFFGFSRRDGATRAADADVYFFDHDFDETYCLDMEFRILIAAYAGLEPCLPG